VETIGELNTVCAPTLTVPTVFGPAGRDPIESRCNCFRIETTVALPVALAASDFEPMVVSAPSASETGSGVPPETPWIVSTEELGLPATPNPGLAVTVTVPEIACVGGKFATLIVPETGCVKGRFETETDPVMGCELGQFVT
jgi:hypothetical protein